MNATVRVDTDGLLETVAVEQQADLTRRRLVGVGDRPLSVPADTVAP